MEKSFLKRAILLIIALVMVTAMLVSCKQKVVEPVEPEKPVVHDVYAVGYVRENIVLRIFHVEHFTPFE